MMLKRASLDFINIVADAEIITPPQQRFAKRIRLMSGCFATLLEPKWGNFAAAP
jgi:hypothetical protein